MQLRMHLIIDLNFHSICPHMQWHSATQYNSHPFLSLRNESRLCTRYLSVRLAMLRARESTLHSSASDGTDNTR